MISIDEFFWRNYRLRLLYKKPVIVSNVNYLSSLSKIFVYIFKQFGIKSNLKKNMMQFANNITFDKFQTVISKILHKLKLKFTQNYITYDVNAAH